MAVGVGLLDHKVLAFDPSQLPQAAAETIDVGMRCDGEPADTRALSLRACGAEPRHRRHCSGEKNESFASFQLIESQVISQGTRAPTEYQVSEDQSAGIRALLQPATRYPLPTVRRRQSPVGVKTRIPSSAAVCRLPPAADWASH